MQMVGLGDRRRAKRKGVSSGALMGQSFDVLGKRRKCR